MLLRVLNYKIIGIGPVAFRRNFDRPGDLTAEPLVRKKTVYLSAGRQNEFVLRPQIFLLFPFRVSFRNFEKHLFHFMPSRPRSSDKKINEFDNRSGQERPFPPVRVREANMFLLSSVNTDSYF